MGNPHLANEISGGRVQLIHDFAVDGGSEGTYVLPFQLPASASVMNGLVQIGAPDGSPNNSFDMNGGLGTSSVAIGSESDDDLMGYRQLQDFPAVVAFPNNGQVDGRTRLNMGGDLKLSILGPDILYGICLVHIEYIFAPPGSQLIEGG